MRRCFDCLSPRAAWPGADSRERCGSSAHYVGYVEDDETPEAIMKKFEALERVQKQAQVAQKQQAGRPAGDEDMQVAEAPEAGGAGAQGEQVLTEEVLLEVFKQTSAFNVKTVQNNGVWTGDLIIRRRLVAAREGVRQSHPECSGLSPPTADYHEDEAFYSEDEWCVTATAHTAQSAPTVQLAASRLSPLRRPGLLRAALPAQV